MVRNMTKRDAFAFFNGAVGRNQRWSWSARSADGRTVVMAVWDRELCRNGNRTTIATFRDGRSRKLTHGNKERVDNLIQVVSRGWWKLAEVA